ncbi:MAG: hypothetical protein LBG74_04450, partial [Spirochaetaceae bacterium]|nr:hypothetical protein [Spirochaetaceae bacterium]
EQHDSRAERRHHCHKKFSLIFHNITSCTKNPKIYSGRPNGRAVQARLRTYLKQAASRPA